MTSKAGTGEVRKAPTQAHTGKAPGPSDWDYPGLGKATHTKRMMLCQGASFALLIALLWANELTDLPHILFHGQPTPLNWCEGAIETAVVLIVAVGVLSWTHRLLCRIRHLEGLLPICMFCKRIRVAGTWVPVDRYIIEHSDVRFSHGMCEECVQTHYPELGRERIVSCSEDIGTASRVTEQTHEVMLGVRTDV